MAKYISGGFDLRLRVELLKEDPDLANQFLMWKNRNRITTDALTWPVPEGVSALYSDNPISYPLGLLNSFEELLAALHGRGVATLDLTPVCLTISEATGA